ncbi:MAG: caspase family protein [Gammaproteobacteria bacterium]|nr:caspase family protein [Gammaproteobacteria bacterium]
MFFNNAYATYPPSFSDCLTGDGEEYDQVDACRQLLQSNSKNYKLHVALTKTLDKRQKYKQSLDAYHKALQAFPNDDYFLKKRLIAESNYKEQQWLRNKKQGTNTKPVISKAESQFKLNKIRCTRMTGKAALEACEKAIKVNDKDSILFVSMGDIHASQQQNKQAIIAYKSAIKLNPDDKLTSQKLKKLTQRKELTKKKQTSQKPAQTKKVQSVKSKPVKNTDSVNTSAPISKKVVSKPEKIQVTSHLDKTVKQSSSKPSSAKVSSSKKAQSNTLKPEQQQFLEQLNLLRSLKEQEIISQAEYEQRKNALLDKTFRVATQEKEKTVSKVISQPAKKTIDSYKGLNFGNYHALIIGNNQYKHLPKLETAVNDAESLAELLKENYGFKVKLLLNANRYDTLKAMGEYRNTLLKDDNLLIYYAGHGVLDKASERGYWLPTDAERDFTSNWISTAEVTDTLKALKSWHVLVVADSCYSGTLARSISIKFNNPEKKHSLIERLLKKKSRTVITSGGLEPVTDSGGDNHSVFSEALLDVLRNTNDVIEAEEVFSRLRDNVILNADQTPEYSNVRKVGHNGGDFIFRRQ